MYSENYKTLWKDVTCSWVGRLNVVKMAVLSKLIYRFKTIFVKIPAGFFAEIDVLNLKLI